MQISEGSPVTFMGGPAHIFGSRCGAVGVVQSGCIVRSGYVVPRRVPEAVAGLRDECTVTGGFGDSPLDLADAYPALRAAADRALAALAAILADQRRGTA